MVDVDPKKIEVGWYVNPREDLRIRVMHFSVLGGENVVSEEHLPKEKTDNPNKKKKKKNNDDDVVVDYKTLPVVVCVAMYRTGGLLEANVASIQRTEGVDLWHFC
jgi:hypothetical protein